MMLVIKIISIQSENEERPVNGLWRYSANTEGTHFRYILARGHPYASRDLQMCAMFAGA